MSSLTNTVKSKNIDSSYGLIPKDKKSSVHKLRDTRRPYLTTPFYTTIYPTHNIGYHPEYLTQYTPYDLFTLRTKITGYIRDILNIKSVGVRYDSIEENFKNVIIVVPINKGKDLNLDKISNEDFQKIQNRINIEVSLRADYCLAFQTSHLDLEYNSIHLPEAWIMHMVPFIDIPDEYYGSYEIEESTSIGYLYLNLRSEDIYDTIYYKLVESITDQLIKMYSDGYVLGAGDIAEKWNLERLDSTIGYVDYKKIELDTNLGIYKPRWFNSRLCNNIVEFLQKLIRNPETLELNITDGCNQVTRYFIAREMSLLLKTVTFNSNTIFVAPIDNLKEAEEIASKIDDLNQHIGRALFVRSSSKEIAYYYAKLMEQRLPYHSNYPPMVYTDNELEISYVTVGLINNFQDPEILQKQIRF